MSGSAVVVEMLDGGLNNVRDRSLMRPGELSRANNVFYKPHDPALHKHPGRALYNTDAAATGTMIGLRYLEFDNDLAYLMRYRSSSSTVGKLGISTFAGETGTFTDYTADIGVGSYLDSVYSKRRHMLLTGAGAATGDLKGNNLVVEPDGVGRRHGLAPVVSPPDPGPVVAGPPATGSGLVSGSWPNTIEFPCAWYFFITTECHKDDDTDPYFLESAWEGKTFFAIKVPTINDSVQIDFPALVNTGKDSAGVDLINARRVYMAGPVGETDPIQAGQPPNPPLSMFRLVAQCPVAQETTRIGGTTLGNLAQPGTVGGDWTNGNNAKVDDGSFAYAGEISKVLNCTNFGLTPSGTVTGVRVEVKARAAGHANSTYAPKFTIQLIGASGTLIGTPTALINTNLVGDMTSWHSFTRGDASTLWGCTAAELTAITTADADFGVQIKTVASWFEGTNATPNLEVDVVRLQVYTSGGVTDIPIGQDFPYVSIPVGGGTTALYPSNSQPPVASTGDTYEGCVVLNDVNEPGDIVWSLPGQPEYFPKPYRMNIDPKHRDGVTCVRFLGDIILVGMEKELWRVHKLPREEDSFFDTTRIKDRVCADKGVVNPNAIQIISTPGHPEIAVFVSMNGIHYTNGHVVDTILSAINWDETVDVSRLSACNLVAYPKYSILAFDYIPPDAAPAKINPTKRLIIHYHPSQIDETGKMKVTGPIDLDGAAMDLAFLSRVPTLVSLNDNGNCYIEDRGWQDAANADANLIMSVLTRDMYPVGVGYEATVERVWWRRHKFAAPDITLTITPWIKKTGADYTSPSAGDRWTAKARTAKTGIPLVGDISTSTNPGSLERTDQHFLCESFALECVTSATNNGFTLSYLAFEVASKGLSDNG